MYRAQMHYRIVANTGRNPYEYIPFKLDDSHAHAVRNRSR